MRIFIFLLLLVPGTLHAAPLELEFSPTNQTVRVLLPATTTPINAVEGTIVVPQGSTVKDVRIGESVIHNWLEAPEEVNGNIRFAGIIPGGFVGAATAGSGLSGAATLFTFTYSGPLDFSLTDAAFYINDGVGTKIAHESAVLSVTTNDRATIQEDRTPPEYIEVDAIEDSSVAEGNYALLLDSYDAESGIDYFEVQEGGGEWVKTSTVYVVSDTTGLQDIRIRAYDRAGNLIETMVPGKNRSLLTLAYALAAVILLVGIGVYWRKKRPYV